MTNVNHARYVHNWFSQVAGNFSDKVAIEYGRRSILYGELDRKINRLANFLIDSGATKGDIIVIFVADRLEVISAMIATLKAGCVFVPLDPGAPEKRNQEIVAKISPDWFLTETACERTVSSLARLSPQKTKVIYLDQGTNSLKHEDHIFCLDGYSSYVHTGQPDVCSQPDDMCYIYFTSGSTGKPKGIAGRLKSIDHFINWEIKTLGVNDQCRVSQLTTPSFDAFLRDVFVPLCAGGTVCIPEDRQVLLDSAELIRFLDQSAINVLHTVPSVLRSILNGNPGPDNFAALRYLLLAGEPVLPVDVRRWMNIYGERVQLVNLYGPSETTMTKFSYFIEPSDADRQYIPVGKPIDGARGLVLDARGKICPPGKIGEIYIRTPFRSLGYYDEPELTREVFIQNPFSDNPEDIIYKTGDLGRVLADGNLELLGRKDHQVKIRGVRVELGELESRLRDHEALQDAVVVDYEDSTGDKYLCAYIVPRRDIHPQELQSFLSQYLLEAAIPSLFVKLDTLPLTITGKVDRKALPPPGRSNLALDANYVAPRTPIEETLANLWEKALRLDRVGVHDNFFALGGHSLLATQLIAQVQAMLQVEVPLRNLFEAPTIAQLAGQVEQILRGGQTISAPPLVPVARTQELPLSFAQQRLWFLDQLDAEGLVYLMPSTQRLYGVLSTMALERSLAELVRRHETLRTTFQARDGQPVQIVHPHGTFLLPVIDLRGLVQEEERASEARRLAGQEARRRCNLAEGPLLRTHLLRLHNEEHVLLLTMHHIISDGWSGDVFYRELTALYQAFVAGQPSSLPPLPIQYADFALWQRQYLQGEILEAQLAYWRQQLAGVPPLELPTDHPRPPAQTFQGAFQTLHLPVVLQEKLIALSQQEGVTLFMLLLTAFQVLLARYSGQDDISVGTAIANRTRPELEGLIGFFVNTLVLRCDLSGNPSFLNLLGRVREVALAAYTHQDVPFEQLVEVLQPQRDLSRSPLFQVSFGVHQAPEAVPGPAGLRVSGLSIEHSTTKFDLTFNVISSPQGLRCGVEYSTALFEAQTIERLLAHWQTLLEGIVAQPHCRLADLPLLTAAEREELLSGWNSPQAALPQEHWLRLFDRQVARRPDALAVVSPETCLSYDCLERHANQLAHLLQGQGVGPEVLVGVCVERSAALLLSLLAIFKAGGGYLPLDPSYPAERLAYMLEQTQAPLVLTRQGWPADSPVPGSSRVLSLGQLWPELLAQPTKAPASQVQPENVAYVIYTSGSTGQPKGVLVPHRGLGPLVQAQMALFEVQHESHMLQFASLSFDASLAEILVCWGAGACLYLPAPEQVLVGEALVRVLEQWAITVVTVPPSVLAQVPPAELAALATLVVAGEDSWASLVQRWAAGRRMCNAYGPSETTVCATVGLCRVGEDRKPPIGKRLEQVRCYVLDAQGQPVPRGVVGELYVGGEGVARGYVGQAAETAERFVPDGFGAAAGGRLYRTGDRVRYVGQAELEYVGRADGQVKVRGYRVELGEIEAVLQGCEGVEQSVVLWHEQGEGEGRLVAYVVGEAGAEGVTSRQVRACVQERLPEYLQPSQVVVLSALPRLPNGKVDRRSLAGAERQQEGLDEEERVAPRTPLEELLAAIWCELLGCSQVGIYDDFFELGGHSLLATRLLFRIQTALQVELPVQMLFDYSTIAELAVIIEQKQTLLINQTGNEELAEMLTALEELSDEEIRTILTAEM